VVEERIREPKLKRRSKGNEKEVGMDGRRQGFVRIPPQTRYPWIAPKGKGVKGQKKGSGERHRQQGRGVTGRTTEQAVTAAEQGYVT